MGRGGEEWSDSLTLPWSLVALTDEGAWGNERAIVLTIEYFSDPRETVLKWEIRHWLLLSLVPFRGGLRGWELLSDPLQFTYSLAQSDRRETMGNEECRTAFFRDYLLQLFFSLREAWKEEDYSVCREFRPSHFLHVSPESEVSQNTQVQFLVIVGCSALRLCAEKGILKRLGTHTQLT